MEKVNTHGIKMIGLRAACSESKILTGYYGGSHLQISYDTKTGKILTGYHVGNSYTVYDDPAVIWVCNLSDPSTMQEISDKIHAAVTVAGSC